MLDSLIYSINAILPIFLLVLLGAVLKRIGWLNDSFTDTADKIVFKIALPIMIFLEVAGSSISVGFDIRLTVFLILSVTLTFAVVSLAVRLTVRDKVKMGALVQGICRSNFAILGVPLAVNMFGEKGGQVIALVLPFIIIMFNSYSVVILSVFSSSSEGRFSIAKLLGILKNIVTNPLIIGAVLALPFMLFDINIPVAADKTLRYLSGLTTPLALFSLGAGLKTESLHGRVGYAIWGAIGKTVILPFIAVTTAILLGFRGPSLGVVLICFGAPTAVSSYIMAKKMDNDYELAGQILLLSTFVCVFTVFAGIFILKSLALI